MTSTFNPQIRKSALNSLPRSDSFSFGLIDDEVAFCDSAICLQRQNLWLISTLTVILVQITSKNDATWFAQSVNNNEKFDLI